MIKNFILCLIQNKTKSAFLACHIKPELFDKEMKRREKEGERERERERESNSNCMYVTEVIQKLFDIANS